MASLVPSLRSCAGRMQAGERRFAKRLVSHLEEDYLCWYDIPVGRRPRYADFLVLHPGRGLLLLEVKDWKLETIKKIDKSTAEIFTNSGLKTVVNPLAQVRQCAFAVIDRLQRDPQLVSQHGPFKGKLIMPYGFGVVLSNITRRQMIESDISLVLPEHQVICKDEMEESVDPEHFQKRLWDMFSVQFAQKLTLPQIDRVRWHLFPEVRIGSDVQPDIFGEKDDHDDSADVGIPNLVKVMDLEQEKLARSLGSGHRVIHGVAGSGKTMILGYRCLYLAKLLHKPILVLCYNIALASRLKALIREHDVVDKVNVYHFHEWCGEMLRRYHVDIPNSRGKIFDRMVEGVIDAVARDAIPRGQYGAVLIDEGHDLKAEWLRLVADMVDPETNSLLLLYDDAQSIYKRDSDLSFSLSSVGIQARGRTTVLKLNYRNTEEILNFAYRFLRQYCEPTEGDNDVVPMIEPSTAGRHGPAPVVRIAGSFQQECSQVVDVFRKLYDKRGISWADMCVTYSQRWMGKEFVKQFRDAGIPVMWLCDSRSKRQFTPEAESVKLMTMHSSKGLEFVTVAACGVGYMGFPSERAEDDAKLLYVAMTRATQNLLITMSSKTEFTEKLLVA